MKKTNKKGFTIVELVIVIAVIAILSAVLIPTFSSIVAKANLAADKQTVRQLNVALAAGEKADTYNEMADALEAQGFNAKYDKVAAPASIGHSYFWSVEHNTIVLVKDNAVVFPENDSRFTSFNADNQAKWLQVNAGNYVVTSTATTAEAAKADIVAAVAGGNSFKLAQKIDSGVKLDAVSVTKSVEIDLAGSKLTTTPRTGRTETPQSDYAFNVAGGATLTVKNAEIEARGIQVKDGATVIIESDVNIVCDGTNGGAAIWAEGADVNVIINGGAFIAKETPENGITELNNASTALSIRDGATCTINNATIENEKTIVYAVNVVNGSNVTINNSTIKGIAGIAATGSSNVTLNNCTIEIDSTADGVSSRHVLYADENATITVNNCTITATLGTGCSVKSNGDHKNGIITITNSTCNGEALQ